MKISPKQYAQTLFEITKDKDQKQITMIIERFVNELRKNGHMKFSAQIIRSFEKVYNEKNNIVQARVITASKLVESQKDSVTEKIVEMYAAKQAEVTYSENKKIKGGIIIRVGDEVIDASVQKRLRLLAQQLT